MSVLDEVQPKRNACQRALDKMKSRITHFSAKTSKIDINNQHSPLTTSTQEITPTSPMPQITITTSRLLLRPAKSSDLHALHAILSSSACVRYWSKPPHTSLSQTRRWLDGMIESRWNGVRDFFVQLRDDESGEAQTMNGSEEGEMIGKVGLWDGSELGIIFGEQYWGKGYAMEALCALLAKVREEKWTKDVTADVDPRNTRCLKLLDGVGFVEFGRREKTFEVEDGWADSVDLFLRIE